MRRIGRRGRPVDLAAVALHRSLKLFEIAIEVGQRVFLDALGVVAQLAAVGEGGETATIAGQQRIGQPAQGHLQRAIVQRLAAGGIEIVMFVAGVGRVGVMRNPRRPSS